MPFPLALLAQPRQRGARQGIERAVACPAAVALQPTDVAMPVKLAALAVWAAARLSRAGRLNDGQPFLLHIEFIQTLLEQLTLAQREPGHLLVHQRIESLGVHGDLLQRSP